MELAFPGESAEYRTARDALLEQAIALPTPDGSGCGGEARAAAGRRSSGRLRFDDGSVAQVKLSEPFAGKPSRLIYSMMLPRDRTDPRPKPASGATIAFSPSHGSNRAQDRARYGAQSFDGHRGGP